MRNVIFDIEKAFLIILVVIGHILSPNSVYHLIVFSFHMPVFFMLTGMLSHWGIKRNDFIIKRARSYVVPYFSWSIFLFLLFRIENPFKYFLRVIYGGSMNTTDYTYPFWFICCLFLSSVIFNYLWNYRKLVVFFLVAWVIIWYNYLNNHKIPILPWSLEVIPFALLYFCVGIITRIIEEFSVYRFGRRFYIIPFMFAIIFVGVHLMGHSVFTINMKSLGFNYFFLDIMYPIIFYLSLKGVAILVSWFSVLESIFVLIGKSSMVIMFIHGSVIHLCNGIYFQEEADFSAFKTAYVMISLVVGCCIFVMFSKNKVLSSCFLGKTISC